MTELSADPGRTASVTRFRVSPLWALVLGVLVTALALAESWRGWPYAPFPLAHAVLAIAIPAACGALPTGRPLPELKRYLPRQLLPLTVALAFIAGFVIVYVAILGTTGRMGDPTADLIALYRQLMQLYVERYGIVPTVVMAYLLLGLWPAIGEELFYRGVVLRGLLGGTGPVAAVVVSSVLFGLRHAAQLTYLLPEYPLGAGVAYFVWAFGLSLVWGWVYVRTRSLWTCIAFHSVNIVLAPLAIVFLLA
jgi:membrane protease YdiL (CAAX protease family)